MGSSMPNRDSFQPSRFKVLMVKSRYLNTNSRDRLTTAASTTAGRTLHPAERRGPPTGPADSWQGWSRASAAAPHGHPSRRRTGRPGTGTHSAPSASAAGGGSTPAARPGERRTEKSSWKIPQATPRFTRIAPSGARAGSHFPAGPAGIMKTSVFMDKPFHYKRKKRSLSTAREEKEPPRAFSGAAGEIRGKFSSCAGHGGPLFRSRR